MPVTRRTSPAAPPADYLAAGLAVAAATGLCLLLRESLPAASLVLVYTSAVLLLALRSGRGAAFWAAILSMLAYNFFLTEPRFTFRISRSADVVTVVSFLVVALVAGELAGRQRRRVVELRAAWEQTRALQALGEQLAAAPSEERIHESSRRALGAALACEIVTLPSPADTADFAPIVAGDARWGPADREAARRAALLRGETGRGTFEVPASRWWFLPLVVKDAPLGLVAIGAPADRSELADGQRELARAAIHLVSIAIDRVRLVGKLESARVESETERLRSALLSSVSHDLRSPLASVIGAASSLTAFGDALSVDDRRQLLDTIRGESERLDRYIQNLLDMTRLGSRGLELRRDWISAGEVVGAAAARVSALFPGLRIVSELPAGLPLLHVHPALVEQALFNVLENAAKFSPPGAPVVVRARVGGASGLEIDVEDRGPGIPADERHKVFDMFYSVSRGDRAGRGTGLGLTIVRGLVGAHGGRVEALPAPEGAGTTIRMTFPVSVPPPVPAGADDE